MVSDIFVRRIPRASDPFLLIKEVTDCTSLRIGHTLALMPVFEHERDLDKGRFSLFQAAAQAWGAEIDVTQDCWSVPFRRTVEAMVNWIAESVEQPWSLDWRELSGRQVLDFSFADSTEGVAFKLLFG